MKPNKLHKISGIYCIKNLLDNKVYVGKSKNIWKRTYQYLYDIEHPQRENLNRHLLAAIEKHGLHNFELSILEVVPLNEDLLSARELHWIDLLESTNRDKGYNLRVDSNSRCLCQDETLVKISNRLRKEWADGKRAEHGRKLSDNWRRGPDSRRVEQSVRLSSTLTKWKYLLRKDGASVEVSYQGLVEKSLQNVLADFHKKECNCVMFKGFEITRIRIIEDIV